MRSLLSLAAVFLFVALPLARDQARSEADTKASAFLKSLDESLRLQAQLPITDEARRTWNFVPMTRAGVTLKQLSAPQTEHARALLKASLSEAGFKKVEQIRGLEDVLYEAEGRNAVRDKSAYVFVVFGEPTSKGTWGWRYEGHHVSLNFTYHDDQLVSSSPQFLGANPADVHEGVHKGRVLGQEQDLGFALLNSLNEEQRASAVTAERAFAEIVTGNQRKVAILEKKGISYKDLTKAQQVHLMELVRAHASVQTEVEQKRRLSRVEPDSLVFGWMGSTKPGAGHYYRIQGSKFLIEYANTQNNANHIHTVWRDFDGDFGEDVLAEHYARAPHDRVPSK